jgi:hypothetical protein
LSLEVLSLEVLSFEVLSKNHHLFEEVSAKFQFRKKKINGLNFFSAFAQKFFFVWLFDSF